MKIIRLTESDLSRIVERVLSEQVKTVTNFDKDYEYKKDGNNYFFKLKASPVSEKAKGFKTQGKFIDWVQATGTGLSAIKTKVFKDTENQSGTISPSTPSKEATVEPAATIPAQVPKTNVSAPDTAKLAVKPPVSQVQKQSRIPQTNVATGARPDKSKPVQDTAKLASISASQIPRDNF